MASDGITIRTAKQACVWCGKVNDAVSHLSEPITPNPGDVMLCIGCSGPAIWTDDGRLRMPLRGELETMTFEQPGLAHDLMMQRRALDALHQRFPKFHRTMKR